MSFKSGVKSVAILGLAMVLLANANQAPPTNNVNILYNKFQSGAETAVNCVTGNKYVGMVAGAANKGIEATSVFAGKTIASAKDLLKTK